MCGICGIYGIDDINLVRSMSKKIAHRGPDQFGHYTDKNISLGHRRLSIVDLSERGRQPMHNEDNSVFIVFNGEIYNHLDLRRELEKKGHRYYSNTDTETIIHAYEEYGYDCLKLFNGCFAFAIYDSNKKSLFLARDRLGIKPLYYHLEGDKLFFASEIKAILAYKQLKLELNKQALNSYLTYLANIDEETMFKGIFKLLPAHYLVFDGKKMKIDRYWKLKISPINKPISYFMKKTREELKKSINLRLMGEVPLGVYLSGGIDSGTVVGLLRQMSQGTIKTFSVGFGYKEQEKELSNAQSIADAFDTEHHVINVKPDTVKLLPKIVYHQDEPMADPTSIPTYILSEFTKKQGVTIALTGEGSDEIFCGYEQYKLGKIYKDYLSKFPKFVRKLNVSMARKMPKKILNSFFSYAGALGDKGIERFEKYILSDNDAERYLEIVSLFDEDEKKEITNIKFDYIIPEMLTKKFFNYDNILNNLMNAEINTTLVENLLMKVDKNTMAHAVEARVPFLDHNMVEYAFSIPAQYKLRGMTDKYVLRKAMGGILPKRNSSAKKQRFFVPIDSWMDKDLKDYMSQILDKKALGNMGLFNQQYIEKIKHEFKRSSLFYTRQLWTLLNFYIWYEQYMV